MVFEYVIVEFDTWVFLMLSKLRLIFLFIVDNNLSNKYLDERYRGQKTTYRSYKKILTSTTR
jgi:hypothetical protein